MTIQRQYSLPNCTLLLEGLSGSTSQPDARPVLITLLNAECKFVGLETTLSGGREFLESLAIAVNQYAQEILSGVQSHATPIATGVELQRLDTNRHRLKVRPSDVPEGSGLEAQLSKEVDLTTVQLFDLVEAVDQFFADSQTLPDLALKLQPLSKRYTRSSEAVAQQAVPAAIGLSGLALAAIAFFFVPIPQVRPPADLVPKPAAGAPGATPSTAPPTAGASPSPATNAADPLEAPLTTAPEITDAAQVDALGKQLKLRLEDGWKNRAGFTQDLVYRLGVTKDGSIVGYKPVNDAALTNAKLTPLLDLLNRQPTGQTTPEPIAQFKAIFTPSGLVEVAPWKEATANKLTPGTEITATRQMEEILPKLRSEINQAWSTEKPAIRQDLTYRVRVKPDGTIVDYKPDSPAATDSVKDTPLPKLGKLLDESVPPPETYALFRVVFKPNGTVELTPWRGWQS